MAASRRLYTDIAAVFRHEKKMTYRTRGESITHIQHAIAEILATDNPSFDREKFHKACSGPDMRGEW